jgi:hypothetical protein
MKLRKGVGSYKVPPIGEIKSAVLDTGVEEARGYLMALMVVQPETIREDVKPGQPRYVALAGDRLLVRPIPDRSGWKLDLAYTPPVERL